MWEGEGSKQVGGPGRERRGRAFEEMGELDSDRGWEETVAEHGYGNGFQGNKVEQ